MEIKFLSEHWSQVVAMNTETAKVDPQEGCIYHGAIQNEDIVDLLTDIKWPKSAGLIHVSRGHDLFVKLKNLRYKVVEMSK